MTTPTPDTYRELAEEIASHLTSGLDMRLDEDVTQRAADSTWVEARLRAALPALSSLLGELAVAREALGKSASLLDSVAEAGGDAPAPGSPVYMLVSALRAQSEDARAALAPGSGRLGREVIRAAAEFHLASLAAGSEVVAGSEGVAEARRRQTAAYDRLARACKAVLAAHPELGREVEGG